MEKFIEKPQIMATRCTFVRHGETLWNREGIYQGQLDNKPGCQLTEQGLNEATALGKRFASETIPCRNFTSILSSDLGRAMSTANNINAEMSGLHLTVATDVRLRERSFGVFEGKTRVEVDKVIGSSSSSGGVGVEGAETANQVQARAVECVEEIVRGNVGGNILVVAHGGTISLLLMYFLGISDQGGGANFEIKNTSVSVVDIWPKESSPGVDALVVTMGDVAHLM